MAEITALESLLTMFVETVKDAVMAPAGIVTLLPTIALRLDDAKETVLPPAGAGPEMINVPVVDVPPTTGDVDQVTCTGIGGSTFNKAL